MNKRNVNVLLLNGKRINILCNPISTTTKQVFEAIVRQENLLENYFLGICALVGGDFVFVPMDLKIYKVAPQIWVQPAKRSHQKIDTNNCIFSLFIRIKLFLPTLRGIR